MPVDLQKFTGFYDQLYKIDYLAETPGIRPRLTTQARVRAAISRGAPFLPLVYRQNFYRPLNAALPDLMNRLQQQVRSGEQTRTEMSVTLEKFYAAIYQHGTRVTRIDGRAELTRLLAVVSNLFRSFTSSNKRASLGIALETETPPVAYFQSIPEQGPHTVVSDKMRDTFGTSIGIVSLPATYRNHPVIWASLTHEVCGHDVVHADPGLVPELVTAVRSMLTRKFAPRKKLDAGTLNALIWSHWMDEAVADVYGILNMGPIFPINVAAFIGALRAKINVRLGGLRRAQPELSAEAGPNDPRKGDNRMDEHPVDILRLYLASGVISSMTKLNAATRADYVRSVEAVARTSGGGASKVRLEGLVGISHDDWIPIKTSMPLSVAAKAARRVGKLIATKKLKALKNHSIQDIETWDDADEETAQAIAGQILKNQSIVGRGDDAQLLAGATLALLKRPNRYDATRSLLNDALDDSYRRDPIWGSMDTDHMFAASAFYRAPPKAGRTRRGGKGRKSSGKKSARGKA
jgi:hypothetical protein